MPQKTILVVDDNEDVRFALTTLLETKGYATACATNGADALTLLRQHTVEPCLILLDLCMPVMDGTEFREAQRRDSQLAILPVVIYSGVADLQQQASALDVPHYFNKPLNLDALVGLVHQYC